MEAHRSYLDTLKEIFPNHSQEVIEDVIEMIETDYGLEDAYKFEAMVNCLSETGDSTIGPSHQGASGFGHRNTGNGYFVNVLGKLFPNICPKFLKQFCEANCHDKSSDDLNDVLDTLLQDTSSSYESESNRIYECLSDMIPDADPDYLRSQADLLADKDPGSLEHFIDDAIDKHKYPTRKDFYKRQKTIRELKMYTTDFSVEEYLKVIPNPPEYFSSSSYISALSKNDITEEEISYAVNCLLNCFPYIREKDIKKIFNRSGKNLVTASDILARIPRHFKTPRQKITNFVECDNLQLLQEIAFIEHKQIIKTAIKMKDSMYRLARAEAEKFNLLETCQCCFYEGLIPEECYFCKKNCPFCMDCVAKGAEHVIGKGELVFPCLSNCNSEFDIATLKMVLDKKVFDPLFLKIQKEEVKNANIEGLETCPFCDFSMILTNNEKIFKCQNPECMEETCRECREKSHVPYRCDEIEYDEDVRKRTYIENKMTEALLRICWKCKKPFIKESGCNKMTCPCGAKTCYVCGAADIDYNHFGETRYNKCPLYTQDLKVFHATRVMNSAKIAKQELGIDQNPHLLKIDPTEGLEEFF